MDVCFREEMNLTTPIRPASYTKGPAHLNGQQAMEVIRFRHNNDGSVTRWPGGECSARCWWPWPESDLLELPAKVQEFVGSPGVCQDRPVHHRHAATTRQPGQWEWTWIRITQGTLEGRGEAWSGDTNCFVFQAEDILPT